MPTQIMLDAALRYATIGIPVVPIWPGGKAPCTDHGVREASTDSRQIKRWWRQWPRADLALACGADAGFDALDVDQQHGGIQKLNELIAIHGPVPGTGKQRTPSGGFHLLFEHQPGLKNRSGGQGEAPLGLDCRTTGGMIKTAPTAGYHWILVPMLGQLPPWPDWLADFYREREAASMAGGARTGQMIACPEYVSQALRYAIRAIDGIAGEIAAAKPGCQEPTLNGASFRAGRLCAAVPGLAADAVIQHLIDAGLAMENEPGRRPWTRLEIERTVRRGFDDGQRRGPADLPAFQTCEQG